MTVVHLADRLMEQQLDALAARLLERALRELGIDVRAGGRTEAVDATTASRCADGDGARPPTWSSSPPASAPTSALARDAGLEVGRGVLVDDELRTSAPGVCAVGECAEHRGTVYGLWAPLLEQARARGRVARRAARRRSTARRRPRR